MEDRTLRGVVAAETIALAALAWIVLGPDAESARELAPRSDAAPTEQPALSLRATTASEAPELAGGSPSRRAVSGAAVSEGALLFGAIADPAGQPVQEATLYLRRQGGGESIAVHRGQYAAFGVAPGAVTLWADAPGYRARQDSLAIDGSRPRIRHDIVLEGAVVLEVFARTPGGQPLVEAMAESGMPEHRWRPGVLASAMPLPDHLPLRDSASVAWLGEGHWSPGLWRDEETAKRTPDWLGSLELQIDPPAHAALMLRQSVVDRELVRPGAERLDFVADPAAIERLLGSLRIEVVDVAGRPVKGARVGVSDAQSGGGGQPVGEDGVLVHDRLPPGIWEIDVFAPDHARHHSLVRVEPGQAAAAQVVLTRPRVLGGIVLDSRGEPTAATLKWDELDARRFPHELIDRRSARANAEGEFTIYGAGAGRYAVHAFDDGTAAHALADTTAGDVGDLVLRLQPTTRTLVASKGDKLSVHLLLVRTPQGLPVWGSEVRGGIDTEFALPRGRYVAEIYRGVQMVRSLELEVGSDEGRIAVP